MSNIVNVTDDRFATEVLQSELPVLVDFWAPWCGPCKMIAPVLEDLSGVYEGKIKICKVDVDVNQTSARDYGVRGIPTLILFKGGKAVETKVGALTRTQLAGFIDANV
jgi:thioredoxin 1